MSSKPTITTNLNYKENRGKLQYLNEQRVPRGLCNTARNETLDIQMTCHLAVTSAEPMYSSQGRRWRGGGGEVLLDGIFGGSGVQFSEP